MALYSLTESFTFYFTLNQRTKKRDWGTLTGVCVPHDTLDQIVDFVQRGSEKTGIGSGRFIEWLDITAGNFYDWRERYGKVNSAIGYSTPQDTLAGRQAEIHPQRDRKLEESRKQRQVRRQKAA
jgi:hypothetical protein